MLNIIAGYLKPDAGYVSYFDKFINELRLEDFYDSISICPQHDPLWDELTLNEHLELYATIRGVERTLIKDTCFRLIP